MQRLSVTPLRVLYARRTLTIPQVGACAATVCRQLEAAAAQATLAVTGPWQFVAHGLPRDAATPFSVDFCLPVSGEASSAGEFALRTLPALDAACHHYHGPLSGLFGHGYAPLLASIAAGGATPGVESREVYHCWQGPDSPHNHIELQWALA